MFSDRTGVTQHREQKTKIELAAGEQGDESPVDICTAAIWLKVRPKDSNTFSLSGESPTTIGTDLLAS